MRDIGQVVRSTMAMDHPSYAKSRSRQRGWRTAPSPRRHARPVGRLPLVSTCRLVAHPDTVVHEKSASSIGIVR
jgi:hypothetical protein